MSLTLRLVLGLSVLLAGVFAFLSWASVRITGDAVERDLARRIGLTVQAVRDHAPDFLLNPGLREEDFRRIADVTGFEILVPAYGESRPGSSLPRETAARVLREAPSGERFSLTLRGERYSGARARVSGRELVLLWPTEPVERAKADARERVVLVCGVALVAAVVLGVALAGTVTRPLRRLADRAAEVREGRADVTFPEGGGREVSHLAKTLREMVAGLARYREELLRKEKMATLGQLSAAVAHELRNPLSSIRMTLQMMREGLPPSGREDLDLMLSEMARLDHSVEELLFHAGTPRYEMTDVEVGEVAAETVRILRPLAEHLGVRVEADLPPAGAPAWGDPHRLRQAMMNLVLNAVQAAPEGSSVTIAVREARDGVEVEVRDEGPGVPAELGERIFEPFVSGRADGTGLGLAVTRAIARAHGGDVELSREGGETRFSFIVPRGE